MPSLKTEVKAVTVKLGKDTDRTSAIRTMIGRIESDEYDVNVLLHEVYINKEYEELNYDDFGQYCVDEFGMSYH